MFLYVISLIIGLFATAALVYAFCRSLDRNYGRRNKRPISYLAPVFLSLFLIFFSIDYTVPRLLDIVSLVSRDYEIMEIELDDAQIRWTALTIEEEPYYYNRFVYKPVSSIRYRMTALPNSHHVLKLEAVTGETNPGGVHEP